MFLRKFGLFVVAALILAVLGTQAQAQKKPVKPSKEFSGSVDDENLMKDAPAVITSVKALEKTWKDWKITDKMPQVDFTKEIVVTATTRGSKIRLFASLDDKGNLTVGGLATRDLRPGFRFVLAVVNREGVQM